MGLGSAAFFFLLLAFFFFFFFVAVVVDVVVAVACVVAVDGLTGFRFLLLNAAASASRLMCNYLE